MLEFLSPYSADDAIVLIKADHEKVKGLFENFFKAESLREKRKICTETILELKLHAEVEEQIFYPTIRKEIGKQTMNEADEEHHVAKVLIAELEVMTGTEDHYEAKYKVLSENIRHHIKEEERDMLPKARHLDVDYTLLGQKMLALKEKLKKTGFSEMGEEKMVTASEGKGDSSAKAAKITKQQVKKLPPKSASKSTKAKVAPKTKPQAKVVAKAKPKAKVITISKSKAKASASNAKKSAAPKRRSNR